MSLADLPVLALVLFTPWFLILTALFWLYPRQPRGGKRIAFDIFAVVAALVLFVASLYLSHGIADPGQRLWPQVLATSVGYGVFLAAMGLAFWLRPRVIGR